MKILKYIGILTLSCLLVACSCSEQENLRETTAPTETSVLIVDSEVSTTCVEETEMNMTLQGTVAQKTTDDTSVYIPNGKTPQLIMDVIQNNAKFTLVDNYYNISGRTVKKDMTLSDYVHKKAQEEDMLVELRGYRVVDMDGDGYNEVLADVPIQMVLLFHYEENEVYAYEIPWNAVSNMSLSGICGGNSGASFYSYNIFEFDKEVCTNIEIALADGDKYFVEKKPVSEEEYRDYTQNDKFKGEVPYWYDYDSLLLTLEK